MERCEVAFGEQRALLRQGWQPIEQASQPLEQPGDLPPCSIKVGTKQTANKYCCCLMFMSTPASVHQQRAICPLQPGHFTYKHFQAPSTALSFQPAQTK